MLRIYSVDTVAGRPFAPNLSMGTQTVTNKRGEVVNILPS